MAFEMMLITRFKNNHVTDRDLMADSVDHECGRTFEQVKCLDGIPMGMRCDLFSGKQCEFADLEKGLYDTLCQQHAFPLIGIM